MTNPVNPLFFFCGSLAESLAVISYCTSDKNCRLHPYLLKYFIKYAMCSVTF